MSAKPPTTRAMFFPWLSHKVRQPLNEITEVIAAMKEKDFSPLQVRYLDAVHQKVHDLLILINDIMDLTRIEEGNFRTLKGRFDLRAAVLGAAELLAKEARYQGPEFQCFVHPEAPTWVIGDVGRLHQIITNLGRISIGQTTAGTIVLDVTVEKETASTVTLLCSINDTGKELPPNVIEQLSDPDSQMSIEALGHNPELYLKFLLSKRLIELLGGVCGFDSGEQGGNSFWFTIAWELAQEASQPLTTGSLGGVRILVVDETDTERRTLVDYIRSWGAYVEDVADAEQGLLRLSHAALDGNPFGIAVISTRMQGQEGENLGRATKADPALAAASLVMIAPVGRRGDAARLRDIGFSAYLTPPVEPVFLRQCLVMLAGNDEDRGETKPDFITRHTLREDRKLRRTVLIADANEIHQMALKRMLEKSGYLAEAASDEESLREAVAEHPFDLVFLDLGMRDIKFPEIYDLFRLSEAPNGGFSVVVGITDAGDNSSSNAGQDAGLTITVARPVTEEVLEQILATLAETPAKPDPVHGGG